MKVFLVVKKTGVSAIGEYNCSDGSITVQKGSIVSEHVSTAPTFQSGAKTVEAQRKQYVLERVVQEDVVFKSLSGAANFVTGQSKNGFREWRVSTGETLKAYMAVHVSEE